MTIRIKRAALGAEVGDIVVGLTPDREALLVQGGDAESVDLQLLPAREAALVSRNYRSALGSAVNRTLKRFVDQVGVTISNSGTAATVTLDAASPFGVPALKVAMPAGNTYTEVQLAGRNLAAFDGHVVWRVWVEDYTLIQQIQAFAGTAGYTRFWQDTHRLNNSDENRWSGEHQIVTGPTRAAVTNTFLTGSDTLADTKLRIFPGAAGGNVWVHAAVVPGIGRPTHVLTHDDASVTWMTNAAPILDRYGLKATFGVNTAQVGTNPALYVSAAQLLELVNAGHQVSGHNVNNTAYLDGSGSGTQDAATYTADAVTAAAALSSWVGAGFDASFHPWVQGRNNSTVHATMRATGMRIGRGTHSAAGYNFPQAGLGHGVMALKTQSLHSMTQPQILAAVNNTRRYGLTTFWMVHEVVTGTPAAPPAVETAVANYDYLCSLIAADVNAGLAVHRRAADLGRELYAERLVAAALQD